MCADKAKSSLTKQNLVCRFSQTPKTQLVSVILRWLHSRNSSKCLSYQYCHASCGRKPSCHSAALAGFRKSALPCTWRTIYIYIWTTSHCNLYLTKHVGAQFRQKTLQVGVVELGPQAAHASAVNARYPQLRPSSQRLFLEFVGTKEAALVKDHCWLLGWNMASSGACCSSCDEKSSHQVVCVSIGRDC